MLRHSARHVSAHLIIGRQTCMMSAEDTKTMINRPVAIVGLFILLMFRPVMAANIELSFDRLPSEQGWMYEGDLPEADVFSSNNGVLRLDARGQSGPQLARYAIYELIDPTRAFTLEFDLRVADADNDVFEVFAVGALGPGFGPRISWTSSPGNNSSQVVIDVANGPVGTTIDEGFHKYLLTAKAGGPLTFYIDGALVAQGNTPDVGFVNVLFFGDSAFANANALVELRQFSFNQADIPEPGTFTLLTLALLASISWHLARSRVRS